ncbi:MAG TPA: hypothetical protein VE127_08360 [Solirubrobacteraceae bacterium]|jgi:hypothetical protein|nr:hypothetical protein [Solirubrobacteraceae bacterium]
MSDLLLAVLERLPSRARRLVVAGSALLALAAVMAALTLTSPHGHRERQPVRQAPCPGRVVLTSPRRLAPPVPAIAIARARPVAERFLSDYLPFTYGRGGALAISGITSVLRQRLLHERSVLTPVERRRRPRVVSLQMTVTAPTFLVVTAVIDDGGVTTYRLRFTLDGAAGRWLVSGVQEG